MMGSAIISDEHLLFIEPIKPAVPDPLIDHIIRRMCAAFRQAIPSDWASGGYHRCCCGALSEDHDFQLPSGDLTNSLCVHYVAHHRSEVPQDQLARIAMFTSGEVEPNCEELYGPRLVPEAIAKAIVEQSDCPSEIRAVMEELDIQIELLKRQKERVVTAGDFESAAQFRDESDKLKKKKEAILVRLRMG